MNLDLDKLEAAARAATPGEWAWGGTPVSTREEAIEICRENIDMTESPSSHFCEVYVEDGRRTALVGHGPNSQANAAFIAAASPAAVLELVRRLRAAEEALAARSPSNHHGELSIVMSMRQGDSLLSAGRLIPRETLLRLSTSAIDHVGLESSRVFRQLQEHIARAAQGADHG